MVLHIYYWILFVIVCIAVLALNITFWINVGENNRKGGSSGYLASISCVVSGLIPIVGFNIFNPETIVLAWKICLIVISIIHALVSINNIKLDPNYVVSLIITLVIASAPFVYMGSLTPLPQFDLLACFDHAYPQSLVTFWLPTLVVVIVASLILRKHEHHYVTIGGQNVSKQSLTEKAFESPLIRLTLENLSSQVSENQEKTEKSLKELKNQLSLFQLHGLSNQSKNTDNKGVDMKIVSQLLSDLEMIKHRLSLVQVKQMNVTNQDLIRELNHFIATPLATISTVADLLQSSYSSKSKDKAKIESQLERLRTSVELCKGIMSTYREIFLQVTQVDDTLDLNSMVKETINALRGKKQIKYNVQIKSKYDNVSNYYMLSTLAPLLSNAITASNENTTIEVKEVDEKIIISNTYQGEINVADFDKDGYSTKTDHRGMGLYTVRHLLSSRGFPTLNYYKKENRIIFEVPTKPIKDNGNN